MPKILDPFHLKLASTPWASSLLPNEKIFWIEKGVVRNLAYDRFWAEKAGKKPTPDPGNLVLDGQDNTLSDLISSLDRGLIVTRLWYIRVVQPKTWQLTGLTRDGIRTVVNLAVVLKIAPSKIVARMERFLAATD
jgi:predicted Zn-dependent protease